MPTTIKVADSPCHEADAHLKLLDLQLEQMLRQNSAPQEPGCDEAVWIVVGPPPKPRIARRKERRKVR